MLMVSDMGTAVSRYLQPVAKLPRCNANDNAKDIISYPLAEDCLGILMCCGKNMTVSLMHLEFVPITWTCNTDNVPLQVQHTNHLHHGEPMMNIVMVFHAQHILFLAVGRSDRNERWTLKESHMYEKRPT
jgi:hypothetical protein